VYGAGQVFGPYDVAQDQLVAGITLRVETTRVVSGRIDAVGEPAEGTWVLAFTPGDDGRRAVAEAARGLQEQGMPRVGERLARQVLKQRPVHADGRFYLSVPTGRPFELAAIHPYFEPVFAAEPAAGREVKLVLDRRCGAR
jgi:hypothetical protein